MTQTHAPNFILCIDPSEKGGVAVAKVDPATEALQIVTLDTPASEIPSDMMQDLNRLMARTFGEF